MRVRDMILGSAIILGVGVYAIAKGKDNPRNPASVPMKTGVICGQGQAVNAAEAQLNEKLGAGLGEATLLMKGRFGSVANPRITAVTMSAVNPEPGVALTYILCASIAGD